MLKQINPDSLNRSPGYKELLTQLYCYVGGSKVPTKKLPCAVKTYLKLPGIKTVGRRKNSYTKPQKAQSYLADLLRSEKRENFCFFHCAVGPASLCFKGMVSSLILITSMKKSTHLHQ